jgi:hypothetical protein
MRLVPNINNQNTYLKKTITRLLQTTVLERVGAVFHGPDVADVGECCSVAAVVVEAVAVAAGLVVAAVVELVAAADLSVVGVVVVVVVVVVEAEL